MALVLCSCASDPKLVTSSDSASEHVVTIEGEWRHMKDIWSNHEFEFARGSYILEISLTDGIRRSNSELPALNFVGEVEVDTENKRLTITTVTGTINYNIDRLTTTELWLNLPEDDYNCEPQTSCFVKL